MAVPSRRGTYFLPGLVLIFGVIASDQYTKWLILNKFLRPHGVAAVTFWRWLVTVKKIGIFIILRHHFNHLTLTPFLNIVMVWNQGISFGMFDKHTEHMALVWIGLALLVSVLLLMGLAFAKRADAATAMSLMIGGALGNVIDRVRFDAVADFLDFHVGHHHWPAFNVADSCIVIGAGILMLGSLFGGDGTEGTT